VCTVELQFAVTSVTICSVTQKCLYGLCVFPVTIKCTLVLLYSVRYYCSILNKFGISREILTKFRLF